MTDILVNLIGSGMTLVAAFIGFWGVIYSQRKLMKMAEEERAHQVQQAKEQASEERRQELLSFANAILGELAALAQSIGNSRKVLAAQIAIAEQLASARPMGKTQPRVSFRFSTPVFDSHVARIGHLSPELSFKLSNFYGHVMSFSAQSQDQVPEMDAQLAARVMRSVDESLGALTAEIETIKLQLWGMLEEKKQGNG